MAYRPVIAGQPSTRWKNGLEGTARENFGLEGPARQKFGGQAKMSVGASGACPENICVSAGNFCHSRPPPASTTTRHSDCSSPWLHLIE